MGRVIAKAAEVAELRAENEYLRRLLTVVEAARMFDRFHAFDAINDDTCPACGGRVCVVETYNAVKLEAV